MSNPSTRRTDRSAPDASQQQIMREIRDQQKQNNAQIGMLTEKVNAFVTAVEVMRVQTEAHAKAIDGLLQREDARQTQAASNVFALDSSRMTWLLMGVGIVVAILSGHLH